MPKTISELRASGQVRRATATHSICLDVDLSDEYRRIRSELFQATAELEEALQAPRPKARLGSRPVTPEERAKVDELSEQLDAIADKMAEFEVEVSLERAESGKWNDWAAENPPREQDPDEAGRRSLIIRDAAHGGRVNFDALINELPAWITQLNGAPATKDDWDWIAGVASPADLDDLGDVVLALHGGRVSVPKSLKSSLGTLLAGLGSTSPEPGE